MDKNCEIKKLKRALETIEKIACSDNEDEKNKPLLDIYKIAHAFTGRCGNKHPDWVELETKIAIKLKNY